MVTCSDILFIKENFFTCNDWFLPVVVSVVLEPVLELALVDQVGLKLTEIRLLCLLSAGIKGRCHHHLAGLDLTEIFELTEIHLPLWILWARRPSVSWTWHWGPSHELKKQHPGACCLS